MRKLALIVLLLSLTANLQLGWGSMGVGKVSAADLDRGRCRNAPASRLHAGMQALVVVDQLRMRALPAVSTGVESQLYSGTALTVISGPSCNGILSWWRVETVDGRRGWVAEGRWDAYYVVPSYGGDESIPNPIEWSCGPHLIGVCYEIE